MGKNHFHQDFIAGLKLAPALHYIASTDLRARYKRSILGPFWIVLSLGLGSVGLGVMWSFLWGAPLHEMLPSITVGFLIWIFLFRPASLKVQLVLRSMPEPCRMLNCRSVSFPCFRLPKHWSISRIRC